MTEAESALCTLLRCVLTGDFADAQALPLSDEVWQSIRDEAKAQAVSWIMAPALSKVTMPEKIRGEWQASVMEMSSTFYNLLKTQDRILKTFAENGCHAVVLKGMAAAVYYPMPWLRKTGDVDLLVKPEQFDTAHQLILSLGAYCYETEYERHNGYLLGKVKVELHRYFSPTHQGNDLEMDALLLEEMARSGEKTIQGFSFPVFPENMNGLVLIQHIRQHFTGGPGFRHIIDWMMFVRTSLTDREWPSFRKLTDRFGLTKLAIAMTRVCQMYFGLPEEGFIWCKTADDALCTELLELSLASGDFGHKNDHNQKIVYVMRKLRRNPFGYLQEAGESNWKQLKKHPWLKPFAWFYQIFRYIRQGLTEGSIRDISDSGGRSARLDQVLKQLDL